MPALQQFISLRRTQTPSATLFQGNFQNCRPVFRSGQIFCTRCINNHVITHLPTRAPNVVSLAGFVFLPFYLSIWKPHIYTLEEWHGIVNSITAPEGVSAQGAPRESHSERLSPKPPRSTANSSVISDQTRPRTDQPCTHHGRWGQSQNVAASSPPPASPISIVVAKSAT